MAWLAVDGDGAEYIYRNKPIREDEIDCNIEHAIWADIKDLSEPIELPKGSIKKLIGKQITWKDEPFELKDDE